VSKSAETLVIFNIAMWGCMAAGYGIGIESTVWWLAGTFVAGGAAFLGGAHIGKRHD